MSQHVQARITELLARHPVVLFMKGVRSAPRCGFSAKATQFLDSMLPDYHSVDVLADEEIRQGIKNFGQFPTIPQLYVRGELIGGSDIISEMFNSGELHQVLGVTAPDRTPPNIEITTQAAVAIRAGMEDDPELALHLQIDARWQAQFQLAPVAGDEIRASAAGIDIYMDVLTAQRAAGMHIDWVEAMQGSGLSVRLPGAPPAVRTMAVQAAAEALRTGSATIIDVRPESDRMRAPLAGVEVLDAANQARLEALTKQRPLAFLCHFGNSSRQAAEHFRQLGFAEVYNIEGGIDAWSQQVDPTIARY